MPSVFDRAALAAGVSAVAALATSPARADGVDPTHGRIDGDLAFVAGAGAALAPRGLRLEGEVRVRYLETGGVYVLFEDGAAGGAEPKRLVSAGVELRPVFMARWLRGLEAEPARVDLAIDSLSLQLGAVWQQPGGRRFGSTAGLELGLGLELPMWARATGPWVGVHAGLRWSEPALSTGRVRDADDRSAYLAVTLAWHQLVVCHVVDVGDEPPP